MKRIRIVCKQRVRLSPRMPISINYSRPLSYSIVEMVSSGLRQCPLSSFRDLVAPGSSSDDEEEEDETGEELKAGKMALLEAAGISSISEKREKKPGQELSISWQPGENIQLSSQDSHLHDKKKKVR